MALNLKRLRDLITYSPPGSYEGPDAGSGEGSYPASLEGPDQGSGEGSLGPMVSRKQPHRQGFGGRLLAVLPDIVSSGVTAAATPNIAGGGAVDIFRGMAAANQAREQRQIHNLSLQHAQNEEARKEADTRSQIASRAALAGFHNSTSELQRAQLADKAKNEEMQRSQAELDRQLKLGGAQAYEIKDETANQPIPEIQPEASTVDAGEPQFEKPRVGIGPEAPVIPNEPPTLKAGLPGNLPGPPMMASARLPKEKAQPAGHYTFNDPTRPNTRLAVPYVKQEADMPIDAETAAALGLPAGTTSIPKKGLSALITGKLKEPKSDPNATLDSATRTAIVSFGGDPAKPADVARGRALVQADAIKQAEAKRQPHETTLMIPDGHGGFTVRNVRAGESIPPGAVSPTGMNSLNVPTANTRGMAEKAPRVLQFVDRINKLLDENEKQLGPLRGRWSDFTAGKIGVKNKGYTQVSTNADLLSTALMNMHVGSKGGEQMMEHFKHLIEVSKQDPDNLRAALGEIKIYAQTVEAEGGPKGAQVTPSVNSTPAEEWVRDASGKLVKK